MKPISELVNDREACERIVSIFTMPGTVERVSFAPTFRFGGYVSIETIAFEIQVYSEGHLIILDGEDTVPYNPFAFVSLMNELGYGPETEKKTAKVLAVEGGGDWADASVDYLVNVCGKSGEDLLNEYRETGGYSGNDRRFFRQWAIESGYCREPNDDEVEVVSEGE